MLKKTLLIAGLILIQAAPSKAMESDDYGFPIRTSQTRTRSTANYCPAPSATTTVRSNTVTSRVVRVAPTPSTTSTPSRRFAARMGVLNYLR